MCREENNRQSFRRVRDVDVAGVAALIEVVVVIGIVVSRVVLLIRIALDDAGKVVGVLQGPQEVTLTSRWPQRSKEVTAGVGAERSEEVRSGGSGPKRSEKVKSGIRTEWSEEVEAGILTAGFERTEEVQAGIGTERAQEVEAAVLAWLERPEIMDSGIRSSGF